MTNKTVTALLITIGLVVTVVSAGADLIGFGTSASFFDEFGLRQIIGTVVGLLIFVAGLRVLWQSRRLLLP